MVIYLTPLDGERIQDAPFTRSTQSIPGHRYPDQVKLFSWSELDNQIQTIKEKMVIWQEN